MSVEGVMSQKVNKLTHVKHFLAHSKCWAIAEHGTRLASGDQAAAMFK